MKIRDLIPKRYKTKYRDENGLMECTWWMWLGKPFKINHYPR